MYVFLKSEIKERQRNKMSKIKESEEKCIYFIETMKEKRRQEAANVKK